MNSPVKIKNNSYILIKLEYGQKQNISLKMHFDYVYLIVLVLFDCKSEMEMECLKVIDFRFVFLIVLEDSLCGLKMVN